MRVEDPLCPSDISPVKGEKMRGVRGELTVES